jgi:hypothetical protein
MVRISVLRPFLQASYQHHIVKKCPGRLVKTEATTVNMVTKFTLRCQQCMFFFDIAISEGKKAENLAWAILGAGSTYTQVLKLQGLLNIKMFNKHAFIAHKRKFDPIYYNTLQVELRKNAQTERDMAIERGCAKDGIPYTCVIDDGGFDKRSHGKFNAPGCVVSSELFHI